VPLPEQTQETAQYPPLQHPEVHWDPLEHGAAQLHVSPPHVARVSVPPPEQESPPPPEATHPPLVVQE
jgi:hypothetical protein